MELKVITQEEYVKYVKCFIFEVGKTYFNKNGDLTVDSIGDELISVTFSDGIKKDINKKFAIKSHLDIYLDKLKSYIGKSKHSKYIAEDKPFTEEFCEENFYWTLGAFARYLNLKAEVGGKAHIEKFVKRYTNCVEGISDNIKSIDNILFVSDHKNGQELRMHIPSFIVNNKNFCLPGVGHIEESTKKKSVVKINNTSLSWMLIEKYGFMFVKTQNLRRILGFINPQKHTFFQEGYKYVCYDQNNKS
jgi:hypothetical protein